MLGAYYCGLHPLLGRNCADRLAVHYRTLALVSIWGVAGISTFVIRSALPVPSSARIRLTSYLALGLGFLFLVTSLGVSTWADLHSFDHFQLIRNTKRTRTEITRLLSAVQDAEISHRGFVITGDEKHLEPYHNALETVARNISSLRTILANRPQQLRQLDEVEKLINSNMAGLAETVSLRREEGFEHAQMVIVNNTGKLLLDDIRNRLNDLFEEEAGILQQQTKAAEHSGQIAVLARILAIAFTLATAVVVILQVNMNLKARDGAESSLRESEERLRQMAENIEEVFWLTDPKMEKVFYVSPNYAAIWGRPVEQLYSEPRAWVESIHTGDRKRVVEAIKKLPSSGRYEEVYRIKCPDKSIHWVRDRRFPIFDDQGALVRVAGVTEDIRRQELWAGFQRANEQLERRVRERTEELVWANRALRESETRLNLAAKAGVVGTWDWDVQSGSMIWNEHMYQFFGVTPSDYNGTYKELIALIHPEDRPGVEQAVAESLETGKSFSVEHRVVWPDNSVHHIAARGEVYSNKGLGSQRMLGVCLDVTHRKATEQALQEAVEDLNRSNSDLEQFAYVASHDLKEPLRMVASYTRLLAEEYEDLLDEEGKKYIHYATDGARRMQALIDDLLTYSRIGRTTGTLKPVDLKNVMRVVRENLSVTLESCGGVLDVTDNLPTVRGCGSLLTGLFQNLIANALKFHGDEPPVVVVSCEQQGDECICSVRDNGIGIPAEHRERIFQVFQRLHARSKYEGTGIGLAICKKAVDYLGGRIWVESTPGQGSTFCFALPLAQATELRVDKEVPLVCLSPVTTANASRSSWLKTTPETST